MRRLGENQFDNAANRRGHYENDRAGRSATISTAKLMALWSAVGSGGTLAGDRHYRALKERNASIKIALADPLGGGTLFVLHFRRTCMSSGSSITEGVIGHGRITANLEGAPVDFGLPNPRRGGPADRVRSGSSGSGCCSAVRQINIADAIRPRPASLALATRSSHAALGIQAPRYASKLFNPAFLRSKNLPVPDWLEAKGAAPKVLVE